MIGRHLSHLQPLLGVGIPACAIDEFRRIVWWNDGAAAFFGIGVDRAINREWHTVTRPARSASCCPVCETRRALSSGPAPGAIDTMFTVGGRIRSVTMVPLPVAGGPQGLIAFLFLHRDVPVATEMVIERRPIPINNRTRQAEENRVIVELTARERELLACIVQGCDARRISVQLGITHATARNYVQRLLAKLGAHNKAEAVRLAYTYNLLAS